MIDVAAGRFGPYHRLFAVPGSRRLAVAVAGAALAGLTASQPVLGLALATGAAAVAALTAAVIRPGKKVGTKQAGAHQ